MQTTVKMLMKLSIFSAKVLEIQIKTIPLHPLSRMNETSSKTSYVWIKKVLKERVL